MADNPRGYRVRHGTQYVTHRTIRFDPHKPLHPRGWTTDPREATTYYGTRRELRAAFATVIAGQDAWTFEPVEEQQQ